MLKHAIALVVSVLVVFGSGADTIQGVEINFATIGSPGYGAPGSLGYVDYSYRIGQTEVSVAQFLASGISTTSTNGSPLRWGSAGSGMPAVYMNWHEAAMYCNFLTTGSTNSGAYTVSGGVVTGVDRAGAIAAYGTAYVLPTEDEWYKAAYFTGSGFSLYANGTGIASIDEIDAVYGRDASAGPWTAGSGTSEQNGTFNMMGNVWEWLETAEDGTLDFDPAERVVFRGGDFFQGGDLLASSTNGVPELLSSAYFNTGLRVVEIIPEPACDGAWSAPETVQWCLCPSG